MTHPPAKYSLLQITLLVLLGTCLGITAPIAAAQNLQLEVAVSDDSVRPGEQFFYSATVSNTSTDTAEENVFLELLIPSNVADFDIGDRVSGTRLTATCPGGFTSICSSGERLGITFGTLDPGESRTIRGPMITLGSAPLNTTLSLFFNAGTGVSTLVSRNESVTIEQPAGTIDLEVSIHGEQSPTAPNGELSYTLSYGNQGTSQASGVVLSAVLPDGVSFVSASDGGTLNTDRVEWTIGNVPPGAGGRRSFTVSDTTGQTGRVLRAEALLQDSIGSESDARAATTGVIRGGLPLAMEVAVAPDPLQAGEQFFYSATLSNTSNVTTLEGVFLELRIPEHVLTFDIFDRLSATRVDADCPGGFDSECSVNELFDIDFGTLAPGESRTVRVPMRVGGSTLNGSLLTLRSRANYTDSPGSLIVTDTVRVQPPLGLTNMAVQIHGEQSPNAPNGELHYTLTYTNSGTEQAFGVELSAILPEAVSFVSASDGGTLNGDRVEWSIGNVPPGTGGRRSFIVSDTAGQTGRVLRAGALIQDNFGSEPDARAVTTSVIRGNLPLTMEVAVAPDPLQAGEQFFYSATLSNTSEFTTLEGVFLELRIPEHVLTFDIPDRLSATRADADCPGGFDSQCSVNELFDIDFGTLAPGESRTVRVPMIVSGDTTLGSLLTLRSRTNYTDSPGSLVVTDTVRVQQVLGLADLTVQIHGEQSPTAPNGELSYTLTYTNSGTDQASSVALSALLPDNVTFVSASDGGSLNGERVEWSIGNVPPGTGGRRSFTVRDTAGQTGRVLRAGALIQDSIGAEPDSRAVTTGVIRGNFPLAMEVAVAPDPLQAGEQFFYSATLSNTSEFTILEGVFLELRIPEHVLLFDIPERLSATRNDADCPGGFDSQCSVNELFDIDVGTLNPGESRTVRVPMTVSGATTLGSLLSLRTRANYSGSRASLIATDTVRVEQVLGLANLAVQIHGEQSPSAPNGELDYTLSYANSGTGQASNVVLSAVLPEDVTFVSASDGGTLNGDRVEWSIGNLPAGFGARRHLTVRDNIGQTGRVLRTEALLQDNSGSEPDSRAVTTSVIRGNLPLAVEVAVAPDPLQAGEQFFYSATVSNTSEFTILEGVFLELRIPEWVLTFDISDRLGGPRSGASCPGSFSSECSVNELFDIDFGTLNPGESRTVRVPMTVNGSTVLGTLINLRSRANYTGSRGSLITTESLHIEQPVGLAALAVQIHGEPSPTATNGQLTFNLSVGNSGTDQASNVIPSVVLPEGVSFVSASDGGSVDGDAVVWPAFNLPAGRIAQRNLVLSDDIGQNGRVLLTEAQLRSGGGTEISTRASTTNVVRDPFPLTLEVAISPNPAGGLLLNAELVNTSGSTRLENVFLEYRVPTQLALFTTGEVNGPGSKTCPGGFGSECTANERLQISFGTLEATESRSVEVPFEFLSNVPDGTLKKIRFLANYSLGTTTPVLIDESTVFLGELLTPGEPSDLIFSDGFE